MDYLSHFERDLNDLPSVLSRCDSPSIASDTSERITPKHIVNIMKSIENITPEHIEDIMKRIETIILEHIENIIIQYITKHITPKHMEKIIMNHIMKHITPKHIEQTFMKHIIKHITSEEHITPEEHIYPGDTEGTWGYITPELRTPEHSLEEELQRLGEILHIQEEMLQRHERELREYEDVTKEMTPFVSSIIQQLRLLEDNVYNSSVSSFSTKSISQTY